MEAGARDYNAVAQRPLQISSMCTRIAGAGVGGGVQLLKMIVSLLTTPSINELARSCKIVQESCMQDLLGTCTRYVPFLARFLHNLAPILARSCKKICKLAGNFYCSISCTISCKICARLCKNHTRKGTYRVHVPSKSCMQDSCTILHDLASSFLLGCLCIHSYSIRARSNNA